MQGYYKTLNFTLTFACVFQSQDEEETVCPKKKLYKKAIMKSTTSPKKKVPSIQVLIFISSTTFYKSCKKFSLKGTFILLAPTVLGESLVTESLSCFCSRSVMVAGINSRVE